MYPPTPALAKAGAAPGTTGGVEPTALSKATQGNAACLPANASNRLPRQILQLHMPQPSVFNGVQACRLPAFKPFKPFKPIQTLQTRQTLLHMPQPSIFSGVQTCRLPASLW